MAVKKIAIYGSTGSIGKQALEVISQYRSEFQITLLTGYSNVELLLSQALEFNVKKISTPNEEAAKKIKENPNGKKLFISWKEAVELIKSEEIDVVLNSIVGAAGLKISVAAVLARKKLLLANKESLVIGGEFLSNYLPYWRDYTIPVDSEHSAIFQALLGENPKNINQIILTASGGPFKDLTLEELQKVKPEDALKHPTWSMGKKITIDSATLMNKGLEVIEAHHLFNVPYEKIKVVVHPQSIVHGMVLFRDGTIKAVMSKPDMKLPIEYAIFYPERRDQLIEPLEYSSMSLSFERPNLEKFPALRLAYEAGKRGGNMPVILNAANEIAVSAFLKEKIKFTDIALVIERTLDSFAWAKIEVLKDIVNTDYLARKRALEIIKEMI